MPESPDMRERGPLPEREGAERLRLEREARAREGASEAAEEALSREGMPPHASRAILLTAAPDAAGRAELAETAAAFEARTAERLMELSAPLRREEALAACRAALGRFEASGAGAKAVWERVARSATGFLDDGERETLRAWKDASAKELAAAREALAAAAAHGRPGEASREGADLLLALCARAEALAGVGDAKEGTVEALARPGPDGKPEYPAVGEAAALGAEAAKALPPEKALEWLRVLHERCAGNWRKSGAVLEANRALLEAVSGALLERFSAPPDDALLLRLAATCSGRQKVAVRYRGKDGRDHAAPDRTMDQDGDLRDARTAGDALRLVLARDGGPLDRRALEGKVPAETMGLPYPSPGACVGAFRACLDKFGNGPDGCPLSLSVLAANGLGRALAHGPDVNGFDFAHLSLSQRMAVLALGKAAAEAEAHPEWDAAKVQGALSGACGPAWEAVMGRVEESVSGWAAEPAGALGLSGTEAEAYRLFCDVRGVGALSFSDTTWAYAREGGKIGLAVGAGVLAAMAAPVVLPAAGVAGAVTAAGASGLAGTAVSQAVSGKGWDTRTDAAKDVGSELAMNTGLSAFGGGL